MTAKPLLWNQPVTDKGDRPSRDLVEIIQRLVKELEDLAARVDVLDGGGP